MKNKLHENKIRCIWTKFGSIQNNIKKVLTVFKLIINIDNFTMFVFLNDYISNYIIIDCRKTMTNIFKSKFKIGFYLNEHGICTRLVIVINVGLCIFIPIISDMYQSLPIAQITVEYS